MPGLKDVLRSIGDAVLPLEKTPTYRKLQGRLGELPDNGRYILFPYSETEEGRLGLNPEDKRLSLEISRLKDPGRWMPQAFDRGALKLMSKRP